MANQWPSVSIIIPNYNGAELLRANVPSVLRSAEAYPGSCEVIVVDDASADDSFEVLTGEFPTVRAIRHPVNRGFADAVHTGVEVAGGDCLIFLNSDVRPDVDFIAPLIVPLQQDDVFSVTPLILDAAGQPTEEAWRCFQIRRNRLRAVRSHGRIPTGPVETCFCSGGSMALRKTAFLALGGFAPVFKPFYSEDSDLGMRAWRRGWRSLFEPSSRVVHDHSHSSIKSHVPSLRVRRIRRRNQFIFEWVHVPVRDLLTRLLAGYIGQALGRLLRLDHVYFWGLAAALRRWPEVRAMRAAIAQQERLSFWAIMARVRASATQGFAPDGPGSVRR